MSGSWGAVGSRGGVEAARTIWGNEREVRRGRERGWGGWGYRARATLTFLLSGGSLSSGAPLPSNAFRSSGVSRLRSWRRKASNLARPSPSTVAPTAHTVEKMKNDCNSSSCFFGSGGFTAFGSPPAASTALMCGWTMRSSRWAPSSRITAWANKMSEVGTGDLHILRTNQRHGGSSHSKSSTNDVLSASEIAAGSAATHESRRGRQPSCVGSMYTIPQRETVAGLATARSIGSKIRFIRLDIAMISPDTRQSFLLSSSTVFIDSIQMASTGPSKTIHCLSVRPNSPYSLTAWR